MNTERLSSPQTASLSPQVAPHNLCQSLLNLAAEQAPVISRTLRHQGRLRVADYVNQQCQLRVQGYQPYTDIAEAVFNSAAPLLGQQVAAAVRSDLRDSANLLTAHHQGVDFFAQSLQSSLLFSLRQVAPGLKARTVPVLACGNIPLDNLTYPRGLMVYRHTDSSNPDVPFKLPLFPDRLKRRIVSVVAPYDQAMLSRLQQRIEKQKDRFEDDIQATLQTVIQAYAAEDVLQQPGYSEQSTLLNNRLWKGLFAEGNDAPELVFLELEKVATELVTTDLYDPFSLLYQVLFKPHTATRLYQGMDLIKGCWNRQALLQRWLSLTGARTTPSALQKVDKGQGTGTFMFWGISDKGDKVPMQLVTQAGQLLLQGVDDRGDIIELPFSPVSLDQALSEGRLLPSVFTAMLTVVFARGMNCLGGYYQADYLARIKQRLLQVMGEGDYANRLLAHVQAAPVEGYLSGMQTLMSTTDNGGLVPAGMLEIMAAGGLDSSRLARLGEVTVHDAHLASLQETLADICPGEVADRMPDWRLQLAIDSGYTLADKIVRF